MSSNNNEKPGEGIRSLRSTTAFRVINFELYAKPLDTFKVWAQCCYLREYLMVPGSIIGFAMAVIRIVSIHQCLPLYYRNKQNIVIMTIGLTCFGLTLGYIAYMRQKYESMGYYSAVDKDGKEIFEKKKSKWD